MRSNFRRKAKRELYRSRRIIMRGEAPVNQVSSATPLYLITRPQKHPPHSFCATPPPSSFLDRERYVPVSGNRPPSDRIGGKRIIDDTAVETEPCGALNRESGSNLVSGRTARDNQRLDYIYIYIIVRMYGCVNARCTGFCSGGERGDWRGKKRDRGKKRINIESYRGSRDRK